jgi:hypothetical protein
MVTAKPTSRPSDTTAAAIMTSTPMGDRGDRLLELNAMCVARGDGGASSVGDTMVVGTTSMRSV